MQLSSREKDMLQKRLDGLSHQQIADLYDYTDTWVRAIIRKAKLKAKIIKYCFGFKNMKIKEARENNER